MENNSCYKLLYSFMTKQNMLINVLNIAKVNVVDQFGNASWWVKNVTEYFKNTNNLTAFSICADINEALPAFHLYLGAISLQEQKLCFLKNTLNSAQFAASA